MGTADSYSRQVQPTRHMGTTASYSRQVSPHAQELQPEATTGT